MQRKTNLPSAREGGGELYPEIGGTFGYVYAIGKLRVVFPSYDVEREYQQLLTLDDMRTTEEEQLYNVLSRSENVFITREVAWLLEIQNVATYRLQPRSFVERQAMLNALKPEEPLQNAYDVIIGVQELTASVELPTVIVNRLYHFTEKSFIESIPQPTSILQMETGPSKDQAVVSFRTLMLSIFQDMLRFQDMLQLTDNAGDADEHRALNYVSLKYPEIYALNWQAAGTGSGDMRFTGVDVLRSSLSRARKVMDVIFNYINSSGTPVRYYTSVDVNGQFPFLVTKFQPYIDR